MIEVSDKMSNSQLSPSATADNRQHGMLAWHVERLLEKGAMSLKKGNTLKNGSDSPTCKRCPKHPRSKFIQKLRLKVAPVSIATLPNSK